MGGQSRRGRSTLAHGSLCRDNIDRWDPLERGCRSTSRPCCGPAHQLFVLELERASRSQLPVPITDGRKGLLRNGLLCDNDADELVVTQPSAVASVGPNGGNRYRKCDDPKNVTLSDNPTHPASSQACTNPNIPGRFPEGYPRRAGLPPSPDLEVGKKPGDEAFPGAGRQACSTAV